MRFSRADTAQLIGDLGQPELADEVRRRDGHVPALRLPFEAEGEPPQGFSTAVLLPLRDDAAAETSTACSPPSTTPSCSPFPHWPRSRSRSTVRPGGSRTRCRGGTRSGAGACSRRPSARELFADRPTEEAQRPWWSVLWALPATTDVVVPQVIHAPTPTDEPLSWPALLIASLPLEPSRRHVAPGRLSDRVVTEAAAAYSELLVARAAAGEEVLGLVPTGLGAGAVDAALRAATLDALRDAPIVRTVEDGALIRPRDAVVIDGPVAATPGGLAALAPYVGGLVDVPLGGRTALRQLGAQQMSLSDVVEALPHAVDPAGWAERYAALAPLAESPEGREALGVLPVPLADGRVVRGARGLLLAPDAMAADVLERLAAAGVRLVHPTAADPLLGRLGALPATPRQLLEDAAVHELVETSPDADDPDEVAATVLGLVRAAVDEGAVSAAGGDLPWLGDLALPDQDDELTPAAALALPGSTAAAVFDPDEIGLVATGLLERWGPSTLTAIGVLADFALVVADEVDLVTPPEEFAELDGFAEWAEAVAGGAVAGEPPLSATWTPSGPTRGRRRSWPWPGAGRPGPRWSTGPGYATTAAGARTSRRTRRGGCVESSAWMPGATRRGTRHWRPCSTPHRSGWAASTTRSAAPSESCARLTTSHRGRCRWSWTGWPTRPGRSSCRPCSRSGGGWPGWRASRRRPRWSGP